MCVPACVCSLAFTIPPQPQVHGYDLLCAFVDRAEELKARFGVDNVHFNCADALTAPLDNAALVFIDNQAWDSGLVTQVWHKLQQEAPLGSLVIEFAAADYYAGIVPSSGMQVRPQRWWVLSSQRARLAARLCLQ